MPDSPGLFTWAPPAAVLIDSYSETNRSADELIDTNAANNSGFGQTFTGTGLTLGSCKFYLKKVGAPTGNATAIITAIGVGTFGTTAVPSSPGAPTVLATSDNLDVSTLPTTQALVTLTFSGANRITLTNGTHYCISLEYSGGSSGNSIAMATDATASTHPGNAFYKDGSISPGYTTSGISEDMCFYIYST